MANPDTDPQSAWFEEFFSFSPTEFDWDIFNWSSDSGEAAFKRAVKLEHALDGHQRDVKTALLLYIQAEEDGHPSAEQARLRLESRLPQYKKMAIAAANVRDKLALYRNTITIEDKKKQREQVPGWLEKRRALEEANDTVLNSRNGKIEEIDEDEDIDFDFQLKVNDDVSRQSVGLLVLETPAATDEESSP